MTADAENPVDHYALGFAVVQEVLKALNESNLERAQLLIGAALKEIQGLPREQASSLLALVLCSLCLLRQREGKAEEAAGIRERAILLVDAAAQAERTVPYHNLMSTLLVNLGEYRRAIPFCERAIELVVDRNQPLAVAELLWREGSCYVRCGLKEHGAVPLRAALNILRSYPGDPRLSSVLIALGNALRKSAPEEAERLYKEAAEIHVAKGQLESAAPAWVNLGILCSEQARHEESLAYYERALRVREQSPATPSERIGSLLNNMANCYRRMGKFEEALRLIDRAIEMLKPKDGSIFASAYGTRGQILDDAGRDAEAVKWLQRSYAVRQKASSPDLELMIENLEREIACFGRLGKVKDAVAAEARLAAAKAAIKEGRGSSVDLSRLTAEAKGAVLVELAFGSRPGGPYGIRDGEIVAEQIEAILEGDGVGAYGGRAIIPETTTLIFYGPDAEAMFSAMEQFLMEHLIFAGAMVVIRQGSEIREVVIPQIVN